VHSTDRHLPLTSRALPPCPAEFFSALDALPFLRAAFIQRCPGIDVVTDRESALGHLWSVNRETADALGFSGSHSPLPNKFMATLWPESTA
jgi:hypothetical protein